MDLINPYLWQIATAAIFLVVLVIVLLLWRAISPSVQGRRGQRLGISEYRELDKMRRLVLIRRDNVEHLILMGGPQDLVIETGIGIPGQASSFAPPPLMGMAPEDDAARSMRPAPRPAVFGDQRPPALRPVETSPALSPLRDPS